MSHHLCTGQGGIRQAFRLHEGIFCGLICRCIDILIPRHWLQNFMTLGYLGFGISTSCVEHTFPQCGMHWPTARKVRRLLLVKRESQMRVSGFVTQIVTIHEVHEPSGLDS